MSQAKKVTIHDVARRAGVSVTTVSLVLSGKGRISEATIGRVNGAVEALGFVRNRQASALRSGQSGAVGLLLDNVENPFYSALVAGASQALEAHKRFLLLAQTGKSPEATCRRLTMMSAQGVDGLIVVGSSQQLAQTNQLTARLPVPVVLVSRAGESESPDSIRPDHPQAARILTGHLIKRGHQCIGWLGGCPDSLTRAERLGGFCATLVHYGLPFRSDWVAECDNSHRAAADALGRLLRRNPAISAVICYNATVATGAWIGLLRAGRQSGFHAVESYFNQQLALGAFAEAGEGKLADIPVSWVLQSARELGRLAALRIVARLDGADGIPLAQTVAPRLIPWRG